MPYTTFEVMKHSSILRKMAQTVESNMKTLIQ